MNKYWRVFRWNGDLGAEVLFMSEQEDLARKFYDLAVRHELEVAAFKDGRSPDCQGTEEMLNKVGLDATAFLSQFEDTMIVLLNPTENVPEDWMMRDVESDRTWTRRMAYPTELL